MSAPISDAVSATPASLQPLDWAAYDRGRAAIVRQMLRLTLLAVALLCVVMVWHVELGAFGGVFASGQAPALGLTGGLAGLAVLVLGAGMAYTWLRLAKLLLRTDWMPS